MDGARIESAPNRLINCLCQPVTHHASRITDHASRITHHAYAIPVNRHPPPVTRHPSPVTRHPSPDRCPRHMPSDLGMWWHNHALFSTDSGDLRSLVFGDVKTTLVFRPLGHQSIVPINLILTGVARKWNAGMFTDRRASPIPRFSPCPACRWQQIRAQHNMTSSVHAGATNTCP
jgi:hypothetical protein